MSEDIQKTMEIRKAVAPMIQTMIKEAMDPLTYLIQPIAKQASLQILAKTDEVFEETRNLISESHKSALGEKDTILRNLSVIEKSIKDSNLELAKYFDNSSKIVAVAVEKLIEKIDQESAGKNEAQKVSGSVSVSNIDNLEKKVDDLSETFEKVITEQLSKRIEAVVQNTFAKIKEERDYQRQYDEVHGFPVKVINQAISMQNGGGGARNTDDRVWLREEFTYTTISGNQVVTRIEHWNHDVKLTEDLEYDGNANVITRSRSLEPSNGTGV